MHNTYVYLSIYLSLSIYIYIYIYTHATYNSIYMQHTLVPGGGKHTTYKL